MSGPPPTARARHEPVLERYPPPTRPRLGIWILLVLAAGVGAFAWYQIDKRIESEVFALEVDSYLRFLQGETDEFGEAVAPDATDTPVAQDTTAEQ